MQDHGRRRHGVRRRGAARAGLHRRLSLQQEPHARSGTRRCCENVRRAFGDVAGDDRPLQRDQRRDGRRPTPTSTRSMTEMGELQDEDRRGRRLDLDNQLEIAMDALRCPPGDAASTISRAARSAASRCAGCCSRSPTSCCSTSRPTTSTPRASRGSRSTSTTIRATSSSSPTTATSSTMSSSWILELDRGHDYPYEGNYSTYLETEGQARSRQEQRDDEARQGASQARARVDPRSSPKARQAKSKARLQGVRRTGRRPRKSEASTSRDPDPGCPSGSAARCIEAEGPDQGLRRPAAVRRPVVQPAARRHRRRDRPQRRRQDDAVQDDRRARRSPTPASIKIGETVQLAYVDQSRDALDPDKTVWEEVSGGLDAHARSASTRCRPAPMSPRSTSRAPTSRRRSASCRAASATASTSPRCSSRAATCCCSTSRPTTSTSRRCARSRRRSMSFPGCAVVISHDRFFLDRLATHILAFEGD